MVIAKIEIKNFENASQEKKKDIIDEAITAANGLYNYCSDVEILIKY